VVGLFFSVSKFSRGNTRNDTFHTRENSWNSTKLCGKPIGSEADIDVGKHELAREKSGSKMFEDTSK
jgi:hypothetical protein